MLLAAAASLAVLHVCVCTCRGQAPVAPGDPAKWVLDLVLPALQELLSAHIVRSLAALPHLDPAALKAVKHLLQSLACSLEILAGYSLTSNKWQKSVEGHVTAAGDKHPLAVTAQVCHELEALGLCTAPDTRAGHVGSPEAVAAALLALGSEHSCDIPSGGLCPGSVVSPLPSPAINHVRDWLC